MKSKKVVVAAIGILIAATLAWAAWQILWPKTKNIYTQKEISIKQTEIPNIEMAAYDDWAGFKFEYPNILVVKEVELDNPQAYSSLEISGNDGKKLTIRITDTAMPDLVSWQKQFNRANSVRKIDQTTLGDLPALRLAYGAPEMILTVALSDGIIYEIKNPADDGFWDRTHQDLVSSWQFTNVAPASAKATAGEGEAITLIEETVE